MVFWGFLSSKLWCFWLTNVFGHVWSWGKLRCRACLRTSSAVKWRLIYYEFKSNLCFWGKKNLESIKSSFYVSTSVFSRLALLVGLFLSCLKTKQCVFVTKQLQLYNFKWGCHLYCEKHPFYFLFFRTCWQSSRFTTNHLCLTLRFPPTDAEVLLSHWQRCCAEQEGCAMNLFPCPGGAKCQVWWQNHLRG